jgi:hypothetical protein
VQEFDKGVQPARVVILQRRLQIRHVARRIGFTPYWTSVVLDGRAPASARFRRHLSMFLDLDEDQLFNYDASGRELVSS